MVFSAQVPDALLGAFGARTIAQESVSMNDFLARHLRGLS